MMSPRSLLSVAVTTVLALGGLAQPPPFASAASGTAAGSRAASDFNGDGFSDLAIGVREEKVGGHGEAGAVNVIYGSPNGLTAAGNQFWTQDSPGVKDRAESGDSFGSALAAGDFDGDGFSDLAIGVPNESFGVGATAAGAVEVLYGSSHGLAAGRDLFISKSSPGVAGDPATPDILGSSLAAGNFGRGAQADLAIGIPQDAFADPTNPARGAALVVYGSPTGIRTTGSQFLTLDTPGVAGKVEPGAEFGTAVAAGDLGKGKPSDLVVGAPRYKIAGAMGAGAVVVLYGSPGGLRTMGSKLWSQGTPSVRGTPESNDAFGAALAVGNFGRSATEDLAIGAPGENSTSGGVSILYGTPNGVTATADQLFTEDNRQIPGSSESGDSFGGSLAAGNMGRGKQADLAVGLPFESYGGHNAAGAANVLYGTPNGLTAKGAQLWTQASRNVLGGPTNDGEQFAFSIAVLSLGKSGAADLAIGVPFDRVGSVKYAGSVNVLYGSPKGIAAIGNQLWNQASPNVKSDPKEDEGFGVTLSGGGRYED